MQRVDKNVVNMANKINILRILWENECIFRAEIARTTGLSQPTVMKIVDEFKERGLITISGKGVSSGGKPPLMLELNRNAYYIIGVDINEYRMEIVLTDLGLNIVDTRIQDNREVDTSDSILKRLADEIEALINVNPDKKDKILGIGVGIPGIIDAKGGIVIYSADLDWQDVNVKSYLRKRFDGQIIIEDSTRALALEEKILGSGKGIKNFLCLSLASEVGSALVMNGDLCYGGSNASGQIGHMAVEREGLSCSCGNYGCLNLYASGRAIELEAKKVVEAHEESLLTDLVYGNADRVDLNVVFEAALGDDRIALDILEKAADYLAMAVSGVISLTDPELIICGGKISKECEIFMQMFQMFLHKRRMRYVGKRVEVVILDSEEYMAAFGSTSFIVEQFLQNGGEHMELLRLKEKEHKPDLLTG